MCGEEFFRARIASLWVETFLYGLYAGLFAGSIYVLTRKRPNKYHLVTTIALFALCSTFMILDLVKILATPQFTVGTYFTGFTSFSCSNGHLQGGSNEPVFTYILLSTQDALSAVAQIIAHGLLIYRCLIIWGRKKLVIVPSLVGLLAMTVLNFVDIYYDVQIFRYRLVPPLPGNRDPTLVEAERMNNILAEISFAFGLATNIITTVLIVIRIWWSTREFERTLGKRAGIRYRSTILMIIESGALYSVSLLVFIIVNVCIPTYVAIPNNAMQQIMGIAPVLIIVRVGLGKGIEGAHEDMTCPTNINNLLQPGIRYPRPPMYAADSAAAEGQEGSPDIDVKGDVDTNVIAREAA
ncbi:hypothetical protein DENSPDRAFT_838460 [Dentipellis sp. KUC8613]|nr:hypothetical protein DENSPDRAFT_838460 [Dentipellis sp. KUC8613]